jgi:putative ABC transport system permease protein
VSPRFFWRRALRESRGGRARLLFSAACLAVGVAAVVAVAGIADGLDQTLRREAKKLLAADLAVEGRRPLLDSTEAALAALPGAVISRVRETTTMVAAPPRSDDSPGPSRLVELKAVDANFPLYGGLGLEPDRPLAELLADGGLVVGPELLDRLAVGIGDHVQLGVLELEIRGVVRDEPDRLSDAFSIGPRAFIAAETLDRADILGPGSRVQHRALVRLPDNPGATVVRATREQIAATFGDSPFFRAESYADAQPSLRASLRRLERFLGLVALLSLLVGGMGVATATRAWLEGRTTSIALLKCLGMRPRDVMRLYLLQSTLLGALGSSVGAVLGLAVQQLVPALVGPDLVPPGAITFWQPWAVLRGVALGVSVAIVFSLPPLVAVLGVPALRALRASAEPVEVPRRWAWGTRLALGLGIAAFASLQARSVGLGLAFTAGLAVAVAIMAAATLWLRTQLGRRRDHIASSSIRYALAALSRPAIDTLGSAVALATGLFVIVALALVSLQLRQELAASLPTNAPSAFLLDIRPDQWEGVREILEAAGVEKVRGVPVVMARLAAIDGTRVDQLAEAAGTDRERRWALTREQRLTYGAELSPDNRIVAGSLWSDPNRHEVSVEEEFAGDMGLALGSTLELDVQGVPIELVVSSLRSVDWRTFDINFFLHVEPGVLDRAPQQILAAARLPAESQQQIQDRLVGDYPNVILIPIRDVLDKVLGILTRLGLGVRFLGGFTVVAGLGILAGALSAIAARRGREVALLKTLGATRAGVVWRFALEYLVLGGLVGGLGVGAGTMLAWIIATQGMDLGWTWRPLLLLAVVVGTAVVTAMVGIASSARALQSRPQQVLRGAD